VVSLPAHLVATPVLECLAGGFEGEDPAGGVAGVVLGAGATAAWVDVGGFVIAITSRKVPLLPNAIALSAGSGALSHPSVTPGATARLTPGLLTLGPLRITWDPTTPPLWDPTVPVPTGVTPGAVGARGAAILRALGPLPGTVAEGAVDNRENPDPQSATLPLRGPQQPVGADPSALVRELARVGLVTAADRDGVAGLSLLFGAVRENDPEPAAAAARVLLGRGPGLTPEADDLLAAVAGTLAVLGPAARPHQPDRDPPPHPPTPNPLLDALTPIHGRTTALSATLLALASQRRLPEPAGRLLDLGPAGEANWPAALARLDRLGHGSGRAYAAGIGVTAVLLAAGAGVG
jgi:Protein of unknown function (DUF2877)